MLVTIKKASKAESADRITFVEFPRIWGLRKTIMQIMLPMSPINPTVLVMIPWRMKVKKMNFGSSSLFPTGFAESMVSEVSV